MSEFEKQVAKISGKIIDEHFNTLDAISRSQFEIFKRNRVKVLDLQLLPEEDRIEWIELQHMSREVVTRLHKLIV